MFPINFIPIFASFLLHDTSSGLPIAMHFIISFSKQILILSVIRRQQFYYSLVFYEITNERHCLMWFKARCNGKYKDTKTPVNDLMGS